MMQNDDIHDVVGVGFGPSNLALAIALEETWSNLPWDSARKSLFLERREDFAWHAGMLLPDSTMQVSFLKDLVTMRNPASTYSFVCYLHAKDRLAGFINSKALYPLRIEFNDYLRWAAAQFSKQTQYSAQVTRICALETADGTGGYEIECVDTSDNPKRDRQTRMVRARKVVISTGLEPLVLQDVTTSDRIWHSSELLDRFADLKARKPQRVAVIGAGQSAAESAAFLHQSLSDTEILVVHRNYGYRVTDDSPFVNGVFDPDTVDIFYGATSQVKRKILESHANTNYGVVDLELSRRLYGTFYQESVSGNHRLLIRNLSSIKSVQELTENVMVAIEYLPTGQVEEVTVDAVICATGYVPSNPKALMPDLIDRFERTEGGDLAVGRDFQVRQLDGTGAGIYIHGAAVELSHGLTSGLLSTVAVRAGEIAQALETSLSEASDVRS